jgi:hypothetical protein
LLKTLGESYTDYIDNLIASKIDDLVKAAVKTYIDASAFDGVYSLTMPVSEKVSIPIKVTVENGALVGGVDFTMTEKSRQGTLKLDLSGTVAEDGQITATWV